VLNDIPDRLVYGSMIVREWQCSSVAVCSSARGCMLQCTQQCAAVRTAVVCALCAGQCAAVRMAVYGSARGSVRLSGSAAVCGCRSSAAVCGSAHDSVCAVRTVVRA
jgi:hypothetical protein